MNDINPTKVAKLMSNSTPLNTTLETYRFHLDTVTEKCIGGWACNTSDHNHKPLIEVRSGETVLWQTHATQRREDLVTAGIGNGECAFTLVPKASALNKAITAVDIYIDGMLAQSNLPLTMAPPETVAPAPSPMPGYGLHLDHYDAQIVRGWVHKDGDDDHRATVEIRSGETVIATGIAEQFREDLLAANIGDGAYCFALTPNLALFTSTECECSLYVDGVLTGVEPFVLQADQASIDEAVYRHAFATELTDFTQSVDAKIKALTNDLALAGQGEVNPQMGITTKQIAQLSVRVQLIENMLAKYFLSK